jgi:hypothetical protein
MFNALERNVLLAAFAAAVSIGRTAPTAAHSFAPRPEDPVCANTCHECDPEFIQIKATPKTSSEAGNAPSEFECKNAPVADGDCSCRTEGSPAPVSSLDVSAFLSSMNAGDEEALMQFLVAHPHAKVDSAKDALVVPSCSGMSLVVRLDL